jgi:hypothetical protein
MSPVETETALRPYANSALPPHSRFSAKDISNHDPKKKICVLVRSSYTAVCFADVAVGGRCF